MKKPILFTAILLVAGIAIAEIEMRNHDLSRRPHAAAPEVKTEQIEGDVNDMKETEADKNHKKNQVHNLSRRPYMEKTDQ